MANSCNKLMKEAIDVAVNEFRGIEFTYKLDDVLDSLSPSQKFSAEQLKGYLLKQGVSPKEIKQSGIFEGMADDNRAISAEDWLSMSGNQHLFKEEKMGIDTLYPDTTLNREGMQDTSKYTETISTIRSPKENAPYPFHFNPIEGESILGWRRTHVQDIDGKKTLVLNEIQSDWAQTERARRGIFESSVNSPKLQEQFKEAKAIIEKYKLEFFGNLSRQEQNKNLPLQDIVEKYWDDWMEYRLRTGPEELIDAEAVAGGKVNQDVVADFPMSEIKHHQFQIVGAIDDALKQGIDTIAIPIQREGADLQGTEGVTKFYENLNKKILPDLRSKLEKQGLKIKVDKTPYANMANIHRTEYGIDDDYVDNLFDTDSFEALKKVMNEPWYKEFENSNDYPFVKPLSEASIDMIAKDSNSILENLATGLIPFGKAASANNKLWKLTVEEIPNARVKWDVYGLLASLGLGGLVSQSEAAEPISTTSGIAPRETNSMSETMRLEGQPNIFRLQDLATGRTQVSKAKPKEKEILDYFSQKESKGDYNAKSSISSAYGKYQFLKDTLAEKARLHGMTVKEARTPQGQEELMRKALKDYEARLRKFDLPITKENLFVVHNLGETGGIRAIRGTYTSEDIERMRNNIPGTQRERNGLSKSEVVKEYYKIHKVTKGS